MKIKRITFLGASLTLFLAISACLADDVFWDDGGSYLINDETHKNNHVYLDYNIANDPGTHVDLDGGKVGQLGAYHNATINMTGGWSDFISTHNDSTLYATGGSSEFGAYDTSFMSFSGGTHSAVIIFNHAVVEVSGDAEFEGIGVEAFGKLNVEGGTLQNLVTHDSSIVNIYKGKITELISAADSSVINIYGYDLGITSTGGSYGHGQVFGFWESGSSFSIDFSTPETCSHIYLIPEPVGITLMAIGGLGLGIRRFRKTRIQLPRERVMS
ncbi:MAG: hypothetical protein JW810_14295 [Sedimentisphaerales bacterium]|nr:hypothetical protein [Sedimentisphaerales bacterium]